MTNIINIISTFIKKILENNRVKKITMSIFAIIILILIICFIKKFNKKTVEAVSNDVIEEEPIIVELEEEEINENTTGIIYLTFDDGPSNSTPQILDILERNKIKATFFLVHYDESREEYVRREKSQGETLGLHGYTHTYSEIYQSADSCMDNFKKIQDQVRQTTGVTSNIIRFPGGSSNTVSKKYCEGVMTELTRKSFK